MSTTNPTPVIDLDALSQEISKLSPEAMEAELLKFRVRQKKQQKKHQGSDQQKKYQAKQREKFKMLKAEAIRLGIWDKINQQAEAQAGAELAKEAEEEPVEDEEEQEPAGQASR